MFNIHIFFVILATIILIIFAELQKLRKITWILIIACTGYILLNIGPNTSKEIIEQSNNEEVLEQIGSIELEPSNVIENTENEVSKIKSTAISTTGIETDTLVMSINSLQIATEIVDREPMGAARLFLNDIEQLYCYTSVNNPFEENTVVHHWYFNNIEYFNYPMAIRESDNWRCWSVITIRPQLTGDWMVTVTDTLGNILAQTEFTILETEE